MRITPIRTIVAALCVTLCFSALLLVGASSAAAGKVSGGVIHACVLTKGKKAERGLLRVVPAAKSCKRKKGEKPISWSVAAGGPQNGGGATGPQGPAGTPGATGAKGEAGPRGETGSVVQVEKTLLDRLNSQTGEITVLTGKVTSLTQELTGLESGLAGLKGTVGGLTSGLKTVEGTTKTLEGTTKTLETNLTKTCNSLSEVATFANGLRTTAGGVNGLLKTLLPLAELPSIPAASKTVECK